jgi:hypothetical protein
MGLDRVKRGGGAGRKREKSTSIRAIPFQVINEGAKCIHFRQFYPLFSIDSEEDQDQGLAPGTSIREKGSKSVLSWTRSKLFETS